MSTTEYNIRSETPDDIAVIHDVNTKAFEKPNEADLVDALRVNGRLLLSLVAQVKGAIVGHIAFSPVTVSDGAATWPAIGLAPVAVLPSWQRQGIGTALINHGLAECRRLGHGVVFVLGHPAYYPRFGFAPTAEHGISCVYDAPPEAFMLLELQPGALEGRMGTVHFAPEFGAV